MGDAQPPTPGGGRAGAFRPRDRSPIPRAPRCCPERQPTPQRRRAPRAGAAIRGGRRPAARPTRGEILRDDGEIGC